MHTVSEIKRQAELKEVRFLRLIALLVTVEFVGILTWDIVDPVSYFKFEDSNAYYLVFVTGIFSTVFFIRSIVKDDILTRQEKTNKVLLVVFLNLIGLWVWTSEKSQRLKIVKIAESVEIERLYPLNKRIIVAKQGDQYKIYPLVESFDETFIGQGPIHFIDISTTIIQEIKNAFFDAFTDSKRTIFITSIIESQESLNDYTNKFMELIGEKSWEDLVQNNSLYHVEWDENSEEMIVSSTECKSGLYDIDEERQQKFSVNGLSKVEITERIIEIISEKQKI